MFCSRMATSRASPTKLLFQMLQCLHHLCILTSTNSGAVRSFERKARELDRFLKPAMPNLSVMRSISDVNNGWVKNMTQALITHYRDQFDFLQGALVACKISQTDMASMSKKAKEWAYRNFGKKLQKETLAKFDKIVKDLAKDLAVPNTVNPVPSTSGGLQSGQARDALPVATPKRRRSLSTPSNSPTQTQASKRVCTSPKTNQERPSYSDISKSPPSRPSVDKPKTAPKVVRFPNLKPNQKGQRMNGVWEIPKVTKDILVLGDSNLSRVSWVDRHDAQVFSYPGLKLHQLLLLLQSFKFGFGSPNPGRKPSKLVLSVGINDRGLAPSSNAVTLRKVVNEAKRIFPDTKICLAQIQCSDRLDPSDKRSISALNNEMKELSSTKTGITCIPPLPKSKFRVVRDNIHWTEDCANATMNHFFSHLN